MKAVLIDKASNVETMINGDYDKGKFKYLQKGGLVSKLTFGLLGNKKMEITAKYKNTFIFKFDGNDYIQQKLESEDVNEVGLEKVFDVFENAMLAKENAVQNPRLSQQQIINYMYMFAMIILFVLVYMAAGPILSHDTIQAGLIRNLSTFLTHNAINH